MNLERNMRNIFGHAFFAAAVRYDLWGMIHIKAI